ncbi:hypothetical protein [Evansella halocellulosilytica]|uniref:hypothetical protein n=1 Tax=Evansella halocellulosilytica TaxID=2011013 RepID=UPI0015C7BF57|nr:hypothetical protein [Evansella halocellulosilytica]
MFILGVAIITSVTFFNTCVTISKKIKNGEDEGADRIFASTMLIIALFCILMIATSG